MMKRKTFTFRDSWFEAMRNLPDNTRLALMDAICSYAIEGKIPENLEMTAQTAFILIRAEIDNTPAPRKKTKPEEDKPSESTETDTATEKNDIPAAADTVSDSFDKAYDSMADQISNSRKWRNWLYAHAGICNIMAALPSFKNFIREQNQTGRFTDPQLPESEFCRLMSNASNLCGFLPTEAFRHPQNE